MVFQRVGPHRPLSLTIGAALLMGSFVPWFFSHYFAPSLVWMAILTVMAIHWMIQRVLSDRLAARAAIATIVVIQAVSMLAEITAANQRVVTWADQRADIVKTLEGLGGEHLILVRYSAEHDVHHEWVYNTADLEHSPVVWARSWRPDLDNQLLQHYVGRQVWLLEFNPADQPTLTQWQ
jgi:hypothetical protein